MAIQLKNPPPLQGEARRGGGNRGGNHPRERAMSQSASPVVISMVRLQPGQVAMPSPSTQKT